MGDGGYKTGNEINPKIRDPIAIFYNINAPYIFWGGKQHIPTTLGFLIRVNPGF